MEEICILVFMSGSCHVYRISDTLAKQHYFKTFFQSYIQPGAELAQLVRWMTLNQEAPGSNVATAIWEKSACAVRQGTLPKVVLDNDHLRLWDWARLRVRIHNINEIKAYKTDQALTLNFTAHVRFMSCQPLSQCLRHFGEKAYFKTFFQSHIQAIESSH